MLITFEYIFGSYTVAVLDDNLRIMEAETLLNLPRAKRLLALYSAKYPNARTRKKSGNHLSLIND